MKKQMMMLVVVALLSVVSVGFADTFGTGANEFSIDFVNISGDASSANGTNISGVLLGDTAYRTFTDSGDYRMGTYEITNDQYAKFAANNPTYTDGGIFANNVSWYEAAQFVNFLNTSTGNQVAYKFNGGAFEVWTSSDGGYDALNPLRNSNAKYFMPTEDEWVKAAYWNGTSLQTYATIGDTIPIAGVDTNYDGSSPWNVGSGSEELNGTFDMMGNAWELMEDPYASGHWNSNFRGIRGSSWPGNYTSISSSYRSFAGNADEREWLSFRVASVPEPCSLVLLSLGGLMLRKRYRR